MGNLGDMVSELEQDCATYKQENLDLEHQLDDMEQDFETMTQQRNKLQEFYDWVKEVYPVIIKDYESVKKAIDKDLPESKNI